MTLAQHAALQDAVDTATRQTYPERGGEVYTKYTGTAAGHVPPKPVTASTGTHAAPAVAAARLVHVATSTGADTAPPARVAISTGTHEAPRSHADDALLGNSLTRQLPARGADSGAAGPSNSKSKSPPFPKMAQNLDLRCVFEPST